jgi:hypothetical protein
MPKLLKHAQQLSQFYTKRRNVNLALASALIFAVILISRQSCADETQSLPKKEAGNKSVVGNSVSVSNALPSIKISTEDLQRSVVELLDRQPEMNLIRQKARELGISSLSLRGRAAASLAHYAFALARHQRGDTAYLESRLDGHFMNIFGWDPDVQLDFLVEGSTDKVQELDNWMKKYFSYFQADLKTLGEINLPRVVSTHQIGLVDLISSDSAPVKDLGHSQVFASDVARQTLHAVPKPEMVKQSPPNLPIFDVLDAMEYASAFELTIEPKYETRLAIEVENFVPRRDLSTPELNHEFQVRGMRMFYYSTDFDHLHAMLKKIDPQKRFGVYSREFKGRQTRLSLGYLIHKAKLLSGKVGRGWGPKPRHKDMSHGTDELWRFASIFRSLKGKLVAFISGGYNDPERDYLMVKESGEISRNGKGLYVSNKPNSPYSPHHFSDFPYVVNLRVDPGARLGTDFNLASWAGDSKNERRVLNAAAVTVVDESNGGDVRDVFERLTKTGGWTDYEHAHLGIHVRRAIADATVDPDKRGEIDHLMQGWLAKKPSFESNNDQRVLRFYFSLPINSHSTQAADNLAEFAINSLKAIIDKGKYYGFQPEDWLKLPISQNYPEFYEILLSDPTLYSNSRINSGLLQALLSPQFIEVVVRHPNYEALMKYWDSFMSQNRKLRALYPEKPRSKAPRSPNPLYFGQPQLGCPELLGTK